MAIIAIAQSLFKLVSVEVAVHLAIAVTRWTRIADWLGLNRATAAVLVVIGCLGLSEEIWSNFLAIHLRDQARAMDPTRAVATAAIYIGVISALKNLLEGFGYVIGGSLAHRLGPRAALALSAIPTAVGFTLMLATKEPWVIAAGAILMTNWEPLSVPATFDVVGRNVRTGRRTIAFAVQSIQKRLPKIVGPAVGGVLLAAVGYWLNLVVAFGLVGLAVVLQLALTRRLAPRPEPAHVPIRQILRTMPPDLQRLLRAEILIRWGDWFARDFAVLYVVSMLTTRWGWADDAAVGAAGWLLALMATTALATYVPIAKWVDRSASPRPFIGVTFLLFALFPIALVVLPRASAAIGGPAIAGFTVAFVINGLRELGEPARKAMITTGFPADVRARAVGVYWGLRSFAFFPAPLVAAWSWSALGPDVTFLLGGAIGLAGVAYFTIRSGRETVA
jgi:MFS family permease